MVRAHEPDLPVDWRAAMGVHHWLAADEDYIDAVVIGWQGMCAVVVAAENVEGRGSQDLHERPQYLITASTAGIPYEQLSLMKRVRCTVPRPLESIEEGRSRIVTSCQAAGVGPGTNASFSK